MSASFEKLLDESLSTVTMKPGSLVTGIVINILDTHVIVHVGLKSEAAIQIQEFFNENPAPGAERTIRQSLESIAINNAWLTKNKPGLESWFD